MVPILNEMDSSGLQMLERWLSCLEMIASGPISSEALLDFFPPPCCASGSNSFPGSHLVVTTYVLKRAIRHLMYGVFSGWPHWRSELFVEMRSRSWKYLLPILGIINRGIFSSHTKRKEISTQMVFGVWVGETAERS